MELNEDNDKILLPHHKQESLCTTRLPYRQGRKLTAVKVYSITKESNHLLIFGVPSLNLHQETKALFQKFGKLLQFNISKQHDAEVFTETFHAQYEKIQPARIAKKMLDTKNFYGSSLHVCYAPEFETMEETRQKLIQRQRDVVYRLKNLEKVVNNKPKAIILDDIVENKPRKLYMGENNTIRIGTQIRVVCKKKKYNKKDKPVVEKSVLNNVNNLENNIKTVKSTPINNIDNDTTKNFEIIDCTNVETEIVTNINESLNYDKFGSEIIKKIPEKPINKIQFHLKKKS